MAYITLINAVNWLSSIEMSECSMVPISCLKSNKKKKKIQKLPYVISNQSLDYLPNWLSWLHKHSTTNMIR